MSAGRSCPLSYRYAPSSLAAEAAEVKTGTETLYVVGGLYGNEPALETVLDLFAAEQGPKHLIFNGDFNWFNIAPDSFRRINQAVLAHDAIRGNVESELGAAAEGAGCGCGYPEWVGEDVVRRSNAIMQRLAATAAEFPELRRRLAALPMFKRIEVGGLGVGVVHGDAESLAGWGFDQESLADASGRARTASWFSLAGVRIFASSHTCLPVLQPITDEAGRACLVANNGAAGMPNFYNTQAGILTRIALQPCRPGLSLYGTRLDGVYVDAVAIPYDHARWQAQFLEQWPPGSDAHASYWERIMKGPAYRPDQADKTRGE